jgi:hypothetical protein
MLSSKKIDLQRDFAAGAYLSEAQNPYSPPYNCIVYSIHIHTGRVGGGGKLNQREGEGATVNKSGSKIPT